jgi:hypothetical protein
LILPGVPFPRTKPRSVREYDLFLPLHYNDGTSVEPEKIDRLKQRLHARFGGMTFFPQKKEGTWKFGNVTFHEEIVIIRVLADRKDRPLAFFFQLKEEIKADLRQADVLIVERKAKVL